MLYTALDERSATHAVSLCYGRLPYTYDEALFVFSITSSRNQIVSGKTRASTTYAIGISKLRDNCGEGMRIIIHVQQWHLSTEFPLCLGCSDAIPLTNPITSSHHQSD